MTEFIINGNDKMLGCHLWSMDTWFSTPYPYLVCILYGYTLIWVTYQSLPLICHWYTVKCFVDTHAVIFHLVLWCFSLFCFENWNSQLIAIYFTASVRFSLLLYMPMAISIVLLTHPQFYLLLTHHQFFVKPAFMWKVSDIENHWSVFI
jgi:hypothetical protein